MQLLQLKNIFLERLIPMYGKEETAHFFYMLCETHLTYTKVDVALNMQKEIILPVIEKFDEAIERLVAWEPIQYIIGSAYFYGNDFMVTKDTLIPRPETEELVDWIIDDFREKEVKILDIGTGSGCIATSLALNLPKASVSAVDISIGALVTANENAKKLRAKVNFEQLDILGATDFFESFDLVVSNPPYVRNLEKEFMQPNVLEYEPQTALFVSDTNPLLFYEKIANLFLKQARKDAVLYFEINEYLGEELTELLLELGFKRPIIKQDFRGKDRMLKAVLY
ncbi:peptide chain release factor N(5)-glutamine methyltransferase [Aquimarina agarilytica]|uniref:peptide chain release factor N(5)-glutamine methyltransferase n=1 Tax=Aquimarina agarilytica TaxID=1087449 RepID=UPI000288BE8C|nr:peptide chain release factor N(5)-glutamine methyltransferase [Aquimarina agarilytica]